MSDRNAIIDALKKFILKEFLEGEDPDLLTEDVELITDGILDSLATLKLILFIESTFSVTIEAYEADAKHLKTLSDIANLVAGKL